MEIQQQTLKQPLDQRRNQKGHQKIAPDIQKEKIKTPKLTGCSKSSTKRKLCSDKLVHYKRRRMSKKQPDLQHTALEKEKMKPKVSRRMEVTKKREGKNEREYERSIKVRVDFLEKNKIDKPLDRISRKKKRDDSNKVNQK